MSLDPDHQDTSTTGRDTTPTILVVDDQHVVLELVDAFLEKSGYRVYLAGGGSQALDICQRLQGAVDLLLTDVRMPEMNGPQLHASAVERHGPMSVLYMSGFRAPEVARMGVPSGAPLIVKPFKPAELQEAVAAALAALPEEAPSDAKTA